MYLSQNIVKFLNIQNVHVNSFHLEFVSQCIILKVWVFNKLILRFKTHIASFLSVFLGPHITNIW